MKFVSPLLAAVIIGAVAYERMVYGAASGPLVFAAIGSTIALPMLLCDLIGKCER